jgi:hypothetical protein
MDQADSQPLVFEDLYFDGSRKCYVRAGDDVFEPIESDPCYSAFATWWKKEFGGNTTGFSDVGLPNSRLFLQPQFLYKYCKNNGIMLLANKGGFHHKNVYHVGSAEFFLLQEVRNFDEKGNPAPVIGEDLAERPHIGVSRKVFQILNADVQGEGDARRISSWPIDRMFVYLDISDFSKYAPAQQAVVINSLIGIVESNTLWSASSFAELPKAIEAMLCIGDGYIFVFKDAAEGTYFGAYLATLIESMVALKKLPVDFHFRMGAHFGPVYSFWDPGRDPERRLGHNGWNYTGDGINGGNRVLTAVGKETDDVMYVSDEVRQRIIAGANTRENEALLSNLHNKGRKADKHGNPWRVFEISHTALCRKSLPLDLRQYA